MIDIQNKILSILHNSATKVHSAGSCGELRDSFDALDADSFSDVAYEIANIIQGGTDFSKSVEPAIRYLLKTHHPHTKIIIDYDRAELLEGIKSCNLTSEVPD